MGAFAPPLSLLIMPFRCHELLLLETYTTKKGDGLELPKFLDIIREVTDDPHYSMYFLSSVQEK